MKTVKTVLSQSVNMSGMSDMSSSGLELLEESISQIDRELAQENGQELQTPPPPQQQQEQEQEQHQQQQQQGRPRWLLRSHSCRPSPPTSSPTTYLLPSSCWSTHSRRKSPRAFPHASPTRCTAKSQTKKGKAQQQGQGQ